MKKFIAFVLSIVLLGGIVTGLYFIVDNIRNAISNKQIEEVIVVDENKYEGNLLKEEITFQSVDLSLGTLPETLPGVEYSLGLEEGKLYKVVFSINDVDFEKEQRCYPGDSPNNVSLEGVLTISDFSSTNGCIATIDNVDHVLLIVENGVLDNGEFVYHENVTSFIVQSIYNDDTPGFPEIVDVSVKAIIPV